MRSLFRFGIGVVGCLMASSLCGEPFAWVDRGRGVAVTIVTNKGPVIYTAIRVDLSHKDFALTTTLGNGSTLGVSQLTSQLESLPKSLGTPVAAMNGDFFMMGGSAQGDPRGLHIFRGELVSTPSGPAAFWQDREGGLHGGKVTSRLTISWPGSAKYRAGLNEQLGTNSLALFTPRMGRLKTQTERRFSQSPNGRSETNAPLAPGPIREPGGREWILENSGSGSWLPLRVGQTYQARVRSITNGFQEVPEGAMVLSFSPRLAAEFAEVTNGLPVTITSATEPDLSGVQTALGTGPMLVHAGQRYEVDAYKSDQLHPRSAVGWNDKYLYLAVADGRQPEVSIGVRLEQMADFLVTLGCDEAINMDGGQSTELVLNGRILNNLSLGARRPQQGGREGNIANAIVVLRRPGLRESED